MPPRADLTGCRCGRLVALRLASKCPCRWLCRCDCGAATTVRVMDLNSGNTKSCGCYHRETIVLKATTHGKRHTAEYRAWAHAKDRCYNVNTVNYSEYGGRGIRMCEQWANDFAAFYAHIGPKPSPAHQLDRIQNDGHYEPGNVRWVTAQESANNRRRQRHYLGRPLPWFRAAMGIRL
jgi:hypothetical protein